MASLKEIKNRIGSVKSTKKITSAMKMIASSKLHRAQAAINNFLPYQQKLDSILTNLLASDMSYESPFIQKRETKRLAIVVFASNSSLAGAYNSNVIKEFNVTYAKHKELGKENILLYPVGKKIADALRKQGLTSQGDYREMADKPSYQAVQDLAKELIAKYVAKEIDGVILIYHHFVSTGTQRLQTVPFLPFDLEQKHSVNTVETDSSTVQTDYILEPSKEEILESLIPTVLYSRLYAALLDANASEHAARTIAMQIASDNADELVQDLTIQYNKSRQQAVTNELLDIIGGASALQ
ncbi:F-type H+-transporting ATPase subunit gamma [Dysgonomonas sp. PFB1-18]|uniref:F0F1 ATP synthase subunit gamma n=1 Tax=unclassified Dysgonomonas TaxID=2630389 RepID=UPI00247427AC|nr:MULTISPECIES: F0F1 ATP synthase subunit gamma [unclassified Dysgonomonas]MDH6308525.1 F-type H+-transporting ATPase subunit gamma [Dysgonomonas sp. PF1-14]MDH6338026.1 F-type H+-transporting ATPase subunit gamma [Dysgonomonas sp. PF1-16]MDH6379523.1 F-type H+-transporting ATPase subunit gamma [Dysgonomonas sp. PFB1-18]MDH6396853.1 F-type H+-transporting ATPase subunit gamma [Dysgonomonas sp. PF1-23]